MTHTEAQQAVAALTTQLSSQRQRLSRAESDLPRLQAQHASLALAQDIDGAANTDALAANALAQRDAADTVQRATAAIAELTRRLAPAQEALALCTHQANREHLARLDNEGAALQTRYESAARECVGVGTELEALSRAREQLANAIRQFATSRRLPLPDVWRFGTFELGRQALTSGVARFDAWLADNTARRNSDAPIDFRR